MLRRTFVFACMVTTVACGGKPRIHRRIIVVSSTPSESTPEFASPPSEVTSADGAPVSSSPPPVPTCVRTAYDVIVAEFPGRTRYEHQVTLSADGNRVFIDEDPDFEVRINGTSYIGAPDLTSRAVCPGDRIEIVRYR